MGRKTQVIVIVLSFVLAVLAGSRCREQARHRAEVAGEAGELGERLAKAGITESVIARAAAKNWAITVARVNIVDEAKTVDGDQFIYCYFEPIHTYCHGSMRGSAITAQDWFAHFPDFPGAQRKELLKEGQAYLLLLSGHTMGKWPRLDRCLEVSGLDDPVLDKLETWLAELGPSAQNVSATAFHRNRSSAAGESVKVASEASAEKRAYRIYGDWPFSTAEAARRQEETARALGLSTAQGIDLGRGVRLAMVLIPAGEFDMGSPAGEPHRTVLERIHRVTIARPFWIGKHEVTQEQWLTVMGKNPSRFQAPSNPVEGVSWTDVREFLAKLNAATSRGGYRLPTEAEWEYACRAGTASAFHFGAGLLADQANFDGKGPDVSPVKSPSLGKTMQVGSFPSNAWGVCDMHGNVAEWCSDWYRGGYYPISPRWDPVGPVGGCPGAASRVVRGGGWSDWAEFCRSAARGGFQPDVAGPGLGFRLCRPVEH